MSVLIRNIKMPETCAGCEWSRYSFPNAWCNLTHNSVDIDIARNGRPDDCPVVEVRPELAVNEKIIAGKRRLWSSDAHHLGDILEAVSDDLQAVNILLHLRDILVIRVFFPELLNRSAQP